MSMNRKGSLFERALVGDLVQQGFQIPRRDAALDHDAKLDFVIHRFPGSIMHHQIGVQVTIGEPNNVRKMQEFLAVHSGPYQKGIQRSIYMQIDEDLDLVGGGGHVIGAAITQFQFSRELVSERVIGLEVEEDLSYRLFSIKDRIASEAAKHNGSPMTAQSQSAAAPATPAIPAKAQVGKAVPTTAAASPSQTSPQLTQPGVLEGQLTYWIPEEAGYGYVQGQDGETYYLHFNSIADDRLRSLLLGVQMRARYPLEQSLEFQAGSKNRQTDKYRPAKNVRLATGRPFPQ
jgi:cold shock CspA family protein